MTETKRYKDAGELTSAEHLQILHAKRVGAPRPKFESGDYRKRKVAALKDYGGLDQEAAELEEQQEQTTPRSPAGHLQRIRRHAAPGRAPRAA